MTTNYHTAISVGAAANAATFNTPLGALDAAITNAQSGVYNVLEYGAVGDGTTDDTTAIQAAIDAAFGAYQGNTGAGVLYRSYLAKGCVYFPAGIYQISATLNYKSVPWRGEGMSNTIIDFRGNGVCVNAVGVDEGRLLLKITDMYFLGDNADVGTLGIKLGWNQRSHGALERVGFYGFPAWAIYFDANDDLMSFSDVYIDMCGTGGTGTGAIGINPTVTWVNAIAWYNLTIEECGVAGSTYAMVDVIATAGGGVLADTWSFFGGTVQKNKGAADFRFSHAWNVLLEGIYDEALTEANLAAGVICDAAVVVISSCRFRPTTTNTGIGISAVNYGRVVILNCQILDWTTNLAQDATSTISNLNGSLGVGNSAAATTLGSVTKKMQVFDAAGVSLGYVAIYDAIT